MQANTPEEFYIDFMIRGRNYTGMVTNKNRNGLSTFIVRYAMEPKCLCEITLELYPVVGQASDPFEWCEFSDTDDKNPCELSLIKIIGDAIEGR